MSADHKAAAEGLLEDVANVLGDVARAMQNGQATPSHLAQAREQAGLNVAIAQARATLYLAEQQRIANILTMASFSHDAENGARLFTDMDAATRWRAEAEKSLGLA